jgi:protocatechuate 3,4-dioxygenase beta subunit
VDDKERSMTDRGRQLLRRREAIGVLGGLAGSAALVATRGGGLLGAPGEAAAAGTCVLSPEVTEGPYWIDTSLTRRDITAGQPGLPLELVLSVQDATACTPIRGADVELWHCDATGVYSGYESRSQGAGAGGGPGAAPPGGAPPTGTPGGGQAGGHQAPTDAKRYLRGHQKSNAAGRVRFDTVYPGWYAGRTPHIHLKVHVGGQVVHTGQLFFDEKITAAVYRQAPYRSHGQPDTSHAADQIYAQAGRSKAQLRLDRRGGGRRGYRGAITLGVAT